MSNPHLRQQAAAEISERERVLLNQLIRLYLADGQPVGSKTLSSRMELPLSPASIRKVMGDLEELGLVSSPHTSAGRIPTARGLRFFVDTLLKADTNKPEYHNLKDRFNPHQTADDLISSTSNLLSQITSLAGIVSVPKREKLILKHVEFVPMAENRVLAILVVNEKEVQNRIIFTDKPYDASALTQASNFLVQHFQGKDLKSARNELLKSLKDDKHRVDSLMQAVIDVAGKAFDYKPNKEYVLNGESNLITKEQSITDLHGLFSAFTEKQQILHLLDECVKTEGVQIFIGEESGYDAFEQCSVITSGYQIDGEPVGVLGVIGPTRMPYDKVIPIVDITAKLLSGALGTE